MEDGAITLVIITALIDKVFSKSEAAIKSIDDGVSSAFKLGIKDYLEKQRDKYSQIKTLLRGNTPVDLYEIYYPLFLQSGKTTIDTENIENLFKKTNCVTIIGDAGSGKSTLMKHLFLNSIRSNYAIPVLLELRYLNEFNDDFTQYIIKKTLDLDIAKNGEALEKLLRKGNFVFFLDGYDELKTSRKRMIIESISDFVTKYNKNDYIITSRPYSDIEQFPTFTNMLLKPLSRTDIPKFVAKQLNNDVEATDKINQSIEISSKENIYVKEFFVNPLLLTLYILAYQVNPSVPDKKFLFYRRVVSALFSEHDSRSKFGFTHELTSELVHEQIEDILKAFCFLSFFEAKYEWDIDYINEKFDAIKSKYRLCFKNSALIDDLKVAVALWIVEDNGDYTFAHRSLQEYFAASYIKHINQDAKESIYKKIIDKIRFRKERGGDYQNILSLLEEMDTLNMYEYYYKPLLTELEKAFAIYNDETMLKSFINFFVKDYAVVSSKIIYNINWQNIAKTFYLHFMYTNKLYRMLHSQLNMQTANINSSFIMETKSKKISFIPLDDNFYKIIKKLDNEIISTAKDLYKEITTKKREVEKYIKLKHDNDKIFIDMI
jgi:GTPase SAR1 family protein